MTSRPHSPLLYALLGVVALALGVVVVLLVRTQAELASLSRAVTERASATAAPGALEVDPPRPGPGVVPSFPAAPRTARPEPLPRQAPVAGRDPVLAAQAPPHASPLTGPMHAPQPVGLPVAPELDAEDRAPVDPPKTPESRAFVVEHQLSPEQWEQLVHVNRNWQRRVDRGDRFGETAIGGLPARISADRERRLGEILGDPEAVRDFHALEGKSTGKRSSVTASGSRLDAVGIE